MRYKNIFEMVGNTPSIGIRISTESELNLYVKLEGHNPTGSIKDRACAAILRSVIDTGRLTEDKVVLDASSGNFACSVAFYSKTLGYRSEVAVSSKVTRPKLEFLEYLGTKVHRIGEFTIEGNEFCRALTHKEPDKYCFLDQLHNWKNPHAHFEATGPEILSEFPDVAMIVGSLGSGGTMTGVAEYFRLHSPNVSIVVVECASGNRIPGTGTFVDGDYITPFIRKARDLHLFDHVVRVTEKDASTATSLLLRQGIFGGLQSGAVAHAALQTATAHHVRGPVVVVSGDSGWKNIDKLSSSLR